MKVAKFGGTSMATADSVRKVKKIICSDEEIKFVVVSAPGKRFPDDRKVTDILFSCAEKIKRGDSANEEIAKVTSRFSDLCDGLKVDFDTSEISTALRKKNATTDYIVSRGEYFCARIFARYAEAEFVDSVDVIRVNERGEVDLENSAKLIKNRMKTAKKAIISGFYGSGDSGEIRLLPRGGSDVIGSVIAYALNAAVYENYTDVNGVKRVDPEIFADAETIDVMSFSEMRALANGGAKVLHPNSVFAQLKSEIVVKNTFEPSFVGTRIVRDCDFFRCENAKKSRFTAFACKESEGTVTVVTHGGESRGEIAAEVAAVLESAKNPVKNISVSEDGVAIVIKTEQKRVVSALKALYLALK